MRLRDLKRADVLYFGVLRSALHNWVLFVFPVEGQVAHVGNSLDWAYEFPTSDEAVAFAKFYFADVEVHVSSLSVEQLHRSMLLTGGSSYV